MSRVKFCCQVGILSRIKFWCQVWDFEQSQVLVSDMGF